MKDKKEAKMKKEELREKLEALKGLPIVFVGSERHIYPDPKKNWSHKMSIDYGLGEVIVQDKDGNIQRQRIGASEYIVEEYNGVITECHSKYSFRLLHVKGIYADVLYEYKNVQYIYGHIPPSIDLCEKCRYSVNGECELKRNKKEHDEVQELKRQLFHTAKLIEK